MIAYILLGVVQGLTEFFPVSSSGHLAILQKLMGMTEGALAVSVVLHLGTVCSLLVFLFKDISALFKNVRELIFIFLVTIVTGIIAIIGKHFFESLFVSSFAVGIGWLITAGVLFLTRTHTQGKRVVPGIRDALILGLTQGCAIAPGVSRAGMTLSTMLFREMDNAAAFRLSFLVAIPAVLGAALLEAKDIDFAMQAHATGIIVGFLASFLTGIFALWCMRKVMLQAKLHYFAYYCMIIGVLTLIFIR